MQRSKRYSVMFRHSEGILLHTYSEKRLPDAVSVQIVTVNEVAAGCMRACDAARGIAE